MMIIDEIQILDDIELEDIVGGAAPAKKKAAKKKPAKKKVTKKKPAKKKRAGHVGIGATSNGGASVVVDQHAIDNAQGLG